MNEEDEAPFRVGDLVIASRWPWIMISKLEKESVDSIVGLVISSRSSLFEVHWFEPDQKIEYFQDTTLVTLVFPRSGSEGNNQ